jgi:hypothetical protein
VSMNLQENRTQWKARAPCFPLCMNLLQMGAVVPSTDGFEFRTTPLLGNAFPAYNALLTTSMDGISSAEVRRPFPVGGPCPPEAALRGVSLLVWEIVLPAIPTRPAVENLNSPRGGVLFG